ncbi:translation repressor protein [uncultured Caudovirales phage]|uniref:Translation repressor protein n=1 Tax=uncultured Caudovirales phage TaxID=2100421 RepID=A0A6J7WXP6_9CAUD|nr:translation repressor protein [uncultured Caudovirales phage]
MFNLSQLIEVRLRSSEDFLKVKETLSRIGLASKKDNTLFQSCHILHKQGRYYIVHFKELFMLDGKQADFSEGDIARRNRIALLLDEWGLVIIENREAVKEPVAPINQIKIIPFKEKSQWNLMAKYTIGSKY